MASRPGIFDQFLLATAVLTRLPVVPGERDPVPAEGAVAAASWAFPAVGAGIGMIAAVVLFGTSAFGLGVTSSALLALVAAGLVTGALHEDGLADTADGFGGGRSRDEKLAIMRDSHSGAYGVLALILSIVAARPWRWSSIGSPDRGRARADRRALRLARRLAGDDAMAPAGARRRARRDGRNPRAPRRRWWRWRSGFSSRSACSARSAARSRLSSWGRPWR